MRLPFNTPLKEPPPQGECFAAFVFNSEEETLEDVQVSITALSNGGSELFSEEIDIDILGHNEYDRYTEAFIENSLLCKGEVARFVVMSASAKVNGLAQDLVPSNQVSLTAMNPLPLTLFSDQPKKGDAEKPLKKRKVK